jgi:hypothetical protein
VGCSASVAGVQTIFLFHVYTASFFSTVFCYFVCYKFRTAVKVGLSYQKIGRWEGQVARIGEENFMQGFDERKKPRGRP